jgi:hypothetical protein
MRAIASAGGVLTQRAAPYPEGDRSEIIEAADNLPEAEGETQDRRIGIADKRKATGSRDKVLQCHDLVALALYQYASYASLQSWQDEHTACDQTGRVSASDLTQFESVALFLHENEGIL